MAATQDGSGVLIARAVITQAAEILALQKLAYRSEAVLYDDGSIPPLTQTLAAIQAEFSTMTILVASLPDGRIIGSVRAALKDGTGEIGRLIVHPDFQHQGIGSRLMAAIEAEFPSTGRFELFTGSRSEANIRLYERLGYRIFSRSRLSERVELVFMKKMNGPG